MRKRLYGFGALVTTFMVGLILALFLPWAAIVMLCLVVILAVMMLIQIKRC